MSVDIYVPTFCFFIVFYCYDPEVVSTKFYSSDYMPVTVCRDSLLEIKKQ